LIEKNSYHQYLPNPKNCATKKKNPIDLLILPFFDWGPADIRKIKTGKILLEKNQNGNVPFIILKEFLNPAKPVCLPVPK